MDRQLAENDIRTLDRIISQYEREIEEVESELDILRDKLENAADAKRIILDMLDAEQVACGSPEDL